MKPIAENDLECLHDYFLCKFLDEHGKFHDIGMWPGHDLDRQYIRNFIDAHTVVTFNGNFYDQTMLTVAMQPNVGTEFLKAINDALIGGGKRPWDIYKAYNLEPIFPDHIDLYEVAPGVRVGLKAYGARMHSKRLQDLPFDPDYRVDAPGRFVLNHYCGNDLVTTRELRNEVWSRIELRQAMSEKYGVDLRSKSDAQIAEAVIKSELGFRTDPRYIPTGFQFRYEAPPYLRFITPELNALLREVQTLPFQVDDKMETIELYGEPLGVTTGVKIPPSLKGRDIIIAGKKYRLGIGGLHSQEKVVNYQTNSTHVVWDIDVTSYYPSLIRTMGMYPQNLGPRFLEIYDGVYHNRLRAKSDAARLADLGLLGAEYDEATTMSDGLKIVLNGTFGKLFSKWSILYAPEFGIRTTVTGQLALLMLIEMMEATGIEVVSANTDGIVLRIPRLLVDQARSNVAWWERTTGLGMEETHYNGIYARDVNNYIAITDKGKVKRKGIFANGGVLSGPQGKGPNQDICADAVVNYLKDKIPLSLTIKGCTDIRKFVVTRHCKHGGVYLPEGVAIDDGAYLGKTLRWYYGFTRGYIGAYKTGDKVAESDWATPAMELPDQMPADINYEHYIAKAKEMLTNIGVSYEY